MGEDLFGPRSGLVKIDQSAWMVLLWSQTTFPLHPDPPRCQGGKSSTTKNTLRIKVKKGRAGGRACGKAKDRGKTLGESGGGTGE